MILACAFKLAICCVYMMFLRDSSLMLAKLGETLTSANRYQRAVGIFSGGQRDYAN